MVLESNTLDVLFVKDGQQGEDGKILYTWIKYAKDASGTGITDDPNGAIYIGISYNNESSIESNDPTQYAWTKIQGADGKKGEDAYTIFLENENVSFATDENRNPLSEQTYTSGITIMKGTKPVTDFTIGDIAKTQGIAVAKTDTAIAISIVNGNPLPNDSGEIEIPITVGDTVFKKILTWTCAKKGEQGDNAKNLSVIPSSQYFKSTDGGKTFAPNTITIKPTLQGDITFGKWQYSIDGGVSFADVVSGQKGLTISNNVLTVSKDSSLYSDAVTMVTFRAVASDSSFYDTCSIAKIYDVSDIGDGRNLLWNSNFAKTDEAITGTTNSWGLHTRGTNLVASIDTSTKHNGFNTLKTVSAANGDKNSSNDLEWFAWGISERNSDNLHSKNQNYTLSFYAKASVTTDFIVRWGYDAYGADTTRTLTTNWQKYEIKLHQATSAYSIAIIFKLLTAGTVWFSEFKLEKGSSATGYSPAPEDVQTAILSTKSEIADVSLKVDNNRQAIEQRVEKTTYQQDLKLVKGDISKANEGLNKWRYEIYPKSLFASEYQGKSTIDVFAKNTNLTPSQSVLINDTDLSIAWNYAENYIGYALTFAKFSAAKSVAITFAHNDGAHIYLNGKLIGGSDAYNNNGESLTLGFVKGWNCIEVVVNEGANTEGFKLGTTISALSECQLMNCYYGTPVARQSHITNQLVENTTNIKGINTKVSKVTSVIGDNGENFTSFKNDYSDFKQTMNGFKTTVGQTYVTKDDFNGLEIGGRNLARKGCIAIWDASATFNDDTFSEDGSVTFSRKSATTNSGVIIDRYVTYEQGQQYVISFKMKANSGTVNSFYLWNGKGHINNSVYVDGIKSGTLHADVSFPTDGQYHQITAYFTATGTTSIEASDIDANQHLILQPIKGTAVTYTVQLLNFKIEKGNKATDWTPAPEDDEINGQNLVSNLPANWEQGTVIEGSAVGTTYANTKSASAGSIRPKELIPVSGYITISTAYSNQSQKPIRHWIAAYDVNKNYLGVNYVSKAWNSFPRTLDMKDAKYLAIMVGYTDSSAITPSDISQICLKIERGTSATPFTLAPEDVNGKIVNVETIANQTAKKFEWIVKGGDSSSNFTLTDRVADLVAERINFNGLVTFSGLNTDAKNEIGKVAQSKVDGLEVGGRNLARCTSNEYSTPYTNFTGSVNTCFDIGRVYLDNLKVGDTITVHMYIKYDNLIEASGETIQIWLQGYGNVTLWNGGMFPSTLRPTFSGSGVYELLYSAVIDKYHVQNEYWNCGIRTDHIQSGSVQVKSFKVEKGNKATDWTPAPEDYLPQVSLVSNWTTNTTWIDGSKIYTGSITADKIAANSITADKIATDAIKSRNYISSGGTQGSFLNLSDGSFTSPNLSWDSNGNLIATNANLSGQITATIGSIGGWNIGDTSLFTGITKSNVRIYDAVNADNAQNMYKKEQHSLILANTYINSFNSSLNSSDNYWHAQGITINDGEFEVGETLYNPNLLNSDTGQIYYDRGLTRVFGGRITMSRDCSINSDSRSLFANITLNGEELYICTNRNILFSPFRTSIFTSEDTSKYNAIETIGDAIIGGNCMLRDRSNGSHKICIYPYDGCIELYGNVPYIDFHYGSSGSDYTSRIIAASGWDCLTFTGSIELGGTIYNSPGGHYTWVGKTDAYLGCGTYNNTNNIYYYAGYHAFYVNGDSGNGMMYIETSGVSSRKGFRNSSDERIKQNFSHFDDNFIDTYMNLEPVQYQFKNDTNDKYHFGFKAQQTERILNAYGEESDKSYGICATHAINPEKAEKLYGVKDMYEEYTLAYDELIAPTTYMVQHTYRELESTKGELTKVKQEKADLEARLQAIEAKLGL